MIIWFMEAFILNKAYRYDIKGKKYINTPYKIEDIGLRNVQLDFRQLENTHIMENVIYNELRFRNFNVDVGVVKSRESIDGRLVRKEFEIDFVANLGSRRYYIQLAYDIPSDDKMKRELQSFDKTKDSFKKIIIINRPIKPRTIEKGYFIIGFSDFLLNQNSLDLPL